MDKSLTDYLELVQQPRRSDESAYEQSDDLPEFIFTGEPSGWTDEDSKTLQAALDLAGITDQADRLKAEMTVDLLSIVILRPLVYQAQSIQGLIRHHFDQIKGGIGKCT